MIYSHSASIVFFGSSISLFLLMQSNALLISSITRCADSILALIALSIISLGVKICSVVDQCNLWAACDDGISAFSLSLNLFMVYTAGILGREERRIIFLRFDGGSFALSGFSKFYPLFL